MLKPILSNLYTTKSVSGSYAKMENKVIPKNKKTGIFNFSPTEINC